MASRTAWTAGNGVGLTWTNCFASADLTSMVSGNTVLSSATAVANGAKFLGSQAVKAAPTAAGTILATNSEQ